MPTTLIYTDVAVAGPAYEPAVDNTTYILTPGISVVSTATAFYDAAGRNGTQLLLAGSVATAAPSAIYLFGANAVVSIAKTGTILATGETGTNGSTVSLFGTTTNFSNDGTILAGLTSGVALLGTGSTGHNSGRIEAGVRGVSTGTDCRFTNTGEISATRSDLVVIGIEAGSGTIVINHGTVTATGLAGSRGVYFTGGTSTLENTGTITSAGGWGVETFVDVNLRVINTGTISGGRDSGSMLCTNGTDRVINRGTLVGDVLLGAGSDTFDGRGGTLLGEVRGGDGSDIYYTSDADMRIAEIAADTGFDTVYSNVDFALNDSLYIEVMILTGGATSATGNSGGQFIFGNHRSNTLSGLGGKDTMSGGAGADLMLGGADTDTLTGDDGADTLDGGDGNDSLAGLDGDDVLRGRAGADRLEGGNDDDRLLGGTGNDTALGGAGDDTLQGGAGTDLLHGGTEADVFVFASVADSKLGGARDIIASDFLQGTDIVDLSAIDAKALTSGNDAFTFIGTVAFAAATPGQLRYLVSGANIVVQGDVNGDAVADFEIQINGQAAITAASFVL